MPTRRFAFTLVEMMVAMVLTLFIMVILSQCFVSGLETFSGLKSLGDMQEQLRTASTLLRADLSADHFEGRRRLSDGASNLAAEPIREGFFVIGQGIPSASNYSAIGSVSSILPYVNVVNPTLLANNPYYEGSDPTDSQWAATRNPTSAQLLNSIPAVRATDHWLHFTVRLRGNAREKFYSAPADPTLAGVANNYVTNSGDAFFAPPGNTTVNSSWAEIVYLMVPTGTVANPSLPGTPGVAFPTPLYALYRCLYVVLPATGGLPDPSYPAFPLKGFPNNPPAALPMPDYFNKYTNLSGYVPNGKPPQFFNPNNLAKGYSDPNIAPPAQRYRKFNPYDNVPTNPAPFSQLTLPSGAALILSNVVSFQVQVSKAVNQATTPGDFDDLPPVKVPVGATTQNVYTPFDTANYASSLSLPQSIYGPAVATAATVPVLQPAYGILALRITLRIWDPKTRLARQVTIVQDM